MLLQTSKPVTYALLITTRSACDTHDVSCYGQIRTAPEQGPGCN